MAAFGLIGNEGLKFVELYSVAWFVVDLGGGYFNLLLYLWKLSVLVVS